MTLARILKPIVTCTRLCRPRTRSSIATSGASSRIFPATSRTRCTSCFDVDRGKTVIEAKLYKYRSYRVQQYVFPAEASALAARRLLSTILTLATLSVTDRRQPASSSTRPATWRQRWPSWTARPTVRPPDRQQPQLQTSSVLFA